MIKSEFKAVFNPFTRELAVLFGSVLSLYQFQDQEEWTKISFNGDPDHPNYLHVQLDYDESLQLLFYPRSDKDESESLNEDLGTYFNSNSMDEIPENITIAFNDDAYIAAVSFLEGNAEGKVEVEYGLF